MVTINAMITKLAISPVMADTKLAVSKMITRGFLNRAMNCKKMESDLCALSVFSPHCWISELACVWFKPAGC